MPVLVTLWEGMSNCWSSQCLSTAVLCFWYPCKSIEDCQLTVQFPTYALSVVRNFSYVFLLILKCWIGSHFTHFLCSYMAFSYACAPYPCFNRKSKNRLSWDWLLFTDSIQDTLFGRVMHTRKKLSSRIYNMPILPLLLICWIALDNPLSHSAFLLCEKNIMMKGMKYDEILWQPADEMEVTEWS